LRTRIGVLASLSLLSSAILLTGCTMGTMLVPESATNEGAIIGGQVHGGRSPVVGSHVYLYQAGTGGTGTAATSLLTSFTTGSYPTTKDGNGNYYVTTDANGNFNMTSEYTPCTQNSQVYMYASGGNTGSGINSAATFMAVVGNCPSGGSLATQAPTVIINEVSTIAAAYAMAGFATDPLHVASSGTALAQTDIGNAFANAAQLYNITLSTAALAKTPAGNGTVPQAEIDSLANSLAACVNTTGANSTPCSTLFGAALNGTTQPVDTATAAINIAHTPAANVSTIFGVGTSTSAYVPVLSAQPNDFSITLTFTNTNISTPAGIAFDAAGNVWLTETNTSAVTEFNHLGKETSNVASTRYFSKPYGAAFDTSGNLWFNASGLDYVDEYNPTAGSVNYISGYPVAATTQIALDGNGYYWTPAYTGTTTEYLYLAYNSGTTAAPAAAYESYSFTGVTDLNENTAVAVDSNNVMWTPSGNTALTSGTGLLFFGYTTVTTGALNGGTCSGNNFAAATGVAIDHSNNVWLSDYNTGYLVEFANNCTYSNSYSVGSKLQGVAIDGSSNIFTLSGYNLIKLSNSGTVLSGSTGFATGITTGTITLPAVDGAGDVWFINSNNSISEVIGIATPVVTPIAAGVKGNTLGYTP
jgi:streptogramin lyase